MDSLMQVLLYILLIEAFFVLLICNFMSKKFKINLLTLKDYKSKDSNNYRYYYNQLAIEIRDRKIVCVRMNNSLN